MNNHTQLHIDDPLSLVELGPSGPVQVLLTRASNAWTRANRDEALRLCHAAMRCAIKTNDMVGTAMAQFFMADAQARSNHPEEGIKFAKQAIVGFKLSGQAYRRNEMAAHLLLARLEQASQNLENANQEYDEALELGQTLQSEAKETARRETVRFYERIIVEIQQASDDVGAAIAEAIADRFDQICRLLDSIPILRLSDGPGMTMFERSNVVGYISTGEFLVAGCTYYLHPFDETPANRLELEAGTVHFALPVAKNGWLDPASKQGDYVLVRKETQVTREGPGVLWTGKKWVGGQFERDATTGNIRFMAPQPHIIGRAQGYAIALLKPVA